MYITDTLPQRGHNRHFVGADRSLCGATGDGKNDRPIEKHILIVDDDGDVRDVIMSSDTDQKPVIGAKKEGEKCQCPVGTCLIGPEPPQL
jgi:hypothetical protein